MAKNPKPDLYGLRKALPAPLTKTYAQYTVEDLRSELAQHGVDVEASLAATVPQRKLEETTVIVDDAPAKPDLQALFEVMNNPPEPEPVTPEEQAIVDQYARGGVPVSQQDPEEMPGQRLNTQLPNEAIRVDEQGRVWYQEEVRKPAYPKPRGRRVLKYLDRGTVTETVQNGEYVETFEVAGVGAGRPAEVKITLPSYQVGIYKDPRFPFKIHTYNGRDGFDLFEVQEYYGGAELVPVECKRIYIENDLCYDVRSVIRAIQNEHRALQLTGRIK